MPTIDLGYRPREQFAPFHARRERWACLAVHRRGGKTVACTMDLIDAALREKKPNGRFAYVAPFYAQAKDVAWNYLKQYTAPIPGVSVNESELRVDLPNGARVRLYGADNYERLRGLYLDGVVLDEYADMDPRVFPEVIRPALSDRQGWATFIGTPKGRNDFYKMHQRAASDDEWYSLILPASVSGLISDAELEDARRIMTPEQYAQEYECDFNAALVGAYYGKDVAAAEREKRICSVPYDKNADVYASWDLGIADATAIWVGQLVGREIHFIDYIHGSNHDMGHYVDVLKSKPYTVIEHFLPHDAEAREKSTGKTITEFLQGRDLRCRIVPRHSKMDRINAVRVAFNKCWFDAEKCAHGLEALRMYQEKRDEKRDVGLGPLHDWASDPADSFGYFIMALNDRPGKAFSRSLEYQPLGIY